MAYEDFTTYIKVPDPLVYTTVTAPKVSYVNLPETVDEYVYKDKGVAHFSGNYEHLITVYMTASYYGTNAIWMLANLVDDMRGIEAAGGDHHAVIFYSGHNIRLRECYAGVDYDWAASFSVSNNTPYYLKIKRDESVGTYGTLYLYIYSDVARTDLLATQSLALHEKEDFRYIYGVNTYNYGLAIYNTAYHENLLLQEPIGRSFGVIMG